MASEIEYQPWGGYQVLEEGEGFKVKKILVNPGEALRLQSHTHRAEHWVVVKGTGQVTVGGQRKSVVQMKPPSFRRRRIIDCSGDGDVAFRAGVAYITQAGTAQFFLSIGRMSSIMQMTMPLQFQP